MKTRIQQRVFAAIILAMLVLFTVAWLCSFKAEPCAIAAHPSFSEAEVCDMSKGKVPSCRLSKDGKHVAMVVHNEETNTDTVLLDGKILVKDKKLGDSIVVSPNGRNVAYKIGLTDWEFYITGKKIFEFRDANRGEYELMFLSAGRCRFDNEGDSYVVSGTKVKGELCVLYNGKIVGENAFSPSVSGDGKSYAYIVQKDEKYAVVFGGKTGVGGNNPIRDEKDAKKEGGEGPKK